MTRTTTVEKLIEGHRSTPSEDMLDPDYRATQEKTVHAACWPTIPDKNGETKS